jgi:prephenate dehydrogenase
VVLVIDKLVVIGVGLIGGSFALALKRSGAVKHVVGVGRNPENLQQALGCGAIDTIAASMPQALDGAGLVLLATPVGQMSRIMALIAPHLDAASIVTDAGSTKQDVILAARQHLSACLERFVPGHPIAGAEQSGASAARADLYRDKNVVLTPLPETAAKSVAMVRNAWEACGARLHVMGAEEHDGVFAAISHLPHLLSYALVHSIAGRSNSAQLFEFAAGGFRDFTRIAASHPEMWRDICIANRGALLPELERYGAELKEIHRILQAGDASALERILVAARAARKDWSEKQGPVK